MNTCTSSITPATITFEKSCSNRSNLNSLVRRVLLVMTMAFVAAVSFSSQEAYAFCAPKCYGDLCGDGTLRTPCCATGKCNIFCCNCDGKKRKGCVSRHCSGGDGLTAQSLAKFNAIDANGSGGISMAETRSFVESQGPGFSAADVAAEFDSMDSNGDGHIQPGEFDSDLK